MDVVRVKREKCSFIFKSGWINSLNVGGGKDEGKHFFLVSWITDRGTGV